MTKRVPIRATTGDRGPPDEGVVIHTVEQLGPKMSLLPNGSLLCRDVPLARTGWMMYGPNETPIKVAKGTDVAYVERTEKELFADETLASFVGASIVDEHPEDDVTPENWRKLAKGVVLTARRGTGDEADLVLGDILVTDSELIASIRAGKREVSAGYDADYTQVSDGVGKQTNIIVNHIALVERGRCGPRCAIGDQAYQPKKGTSMTTKRVQIHQGGGTRRVPLTTLRQRVADAEAALAEAEEANDENDGDPQTGDTHIHIHTTPASEGHMPNAGAKDDDMGDDEDDKTQDGDNPLDARITAIEASIEKLTESVAALVAGKNNQTDDSDGIEDPDADDVDNDGHPDSVAAGDDKDKPGQTTDDGDMEDDDKKSGKTMDSAALERGFTQTLAKAEILVPGFRLPTFDAAKPRRKTIDAMCGLRRKVLDTAFATKDGAALIKGVTGRATLDLASMGCKDVATIFNAAAGAKSLLNNAVATRDSGSHQQQQVARSGPKSLAEINKANAEYWSKRTGV